MLMQSAKQKEFLAKNAMERPYYTAEEFVATRILRAINASGEKAYQYLLCALAQSMADCEHKSRWEVAAYLLKRRITVNLAVDRPQLVAMPISALETYRGRKAPEIGKFIRDSPHDQQRVHSDYGPNFYVFRTAEMHCVLGYVCWNLSILGHIAAPVGLHPGPRDDSRIVVQSLDVFLKSVEFQDIARELMIE